MCQARLISPSKGHVETSVRRFKPCSHISSTTSGCLRGAYGIAYVRCFNASITREKAREV
jgi:hypothetical protein